MCHVQECMCFMNPAISLVENGVGAFGHLHVYDLGGFLFLLYGKASMMDSTSVQMSSSSCGRSMLEEGSTLSHAFGVLRRPGVIRVGNNLRVGDDEDIFGCAVEC